MIQKITEKARAMMLDSQAPIVFWGGAVNTAAYLHQRTPNEGLRREQRQYLTPYEMLHAHGKPISDSDGNEISRETRWQIQLQKDVNGITSEEASIHTSKEASTPLIKCDNQGALAIVSTGIQMVNTSGFCTMLITFQNIQAALL